MRSYKDQSLLFDPHEFFPPKKLRKLERREELRKLEVLTNANYIASLVWFAVVKDFQDHGIDSAHAPIDWTPAVPCNIQCTFGKYWTCERPALLEVHVTLRDAVTGENPRVVSMSDSEAWRMVRWDRRIDRTYRTWRDFPRSDYKFKPRTPAPKDEPRYWGPAKVTAPVVRPCKGKPKKKFKYNSE